MRSSWRPWTILECVEGERWMGRRDAVRASAKVDGDHKGNAVA